MREPNQKLILLQILVLELVNQILRHFQKREPERLTQMCLKKNIITVMSIVVTGQAVKLGEVQGCLVIVGTYQSHQELVRHQSHREQEFQSHRELCLVDQSHCWGKNRKGCFATGRTLLKGRFDVTRQLSLSLLFANVYFLLILCHYLCPV